MSDETTNPSDEEAQAVPAPSAPDFESMLNRVAEAAATRAVAVASTPSASVAPYKSPALVGELVDEPASLFSPEMLADRQKLIETARQHYPNHPHALHKEIAGAFQARNPIALAYAHAGVSMNHKDGLDAQALARALSESRCHWLAMYPPEPEDPRELSQVELLEAENKDLKARMERIERLFLQANSPQLAGAAR